MSDKSPLVLSARETETLAIAWQCFKTQPEIDFDKFASLAGYTTGSAKVTLGNIKRKLKNHADGVAADPATPKKPATASTGRPKKRGTDGEESPTKKAKATPKKGKAKGKKAADNEDDDEFAHVKIKSEELQGVTNDFQQYLQQPALSSGFDTVMDGLYAERHEEEEEA